MIHFREFVLLDVLFIVGHERDSLLFSRVLLTDDWRHGPSCCNREELIKQSKVRQATRPFARNM
jgi:hypothetical protein